MVVDRSPRHPSAVAQTTVVVAAEVVPTDEAALGALVGSLVARGVGRVAVDAPSALSTLPHAGDVTLGAKFRAARCGEVALGRERGVWVPWVSPPAPPLAGWMDVGLRLFAGLAAAGLDAVETFPQAVFRAWTGGAPLPPKSRPDGLAARARLLAAAGLAEPSLAVWTHDGLDAAACALVACGPSVAVTCGHDGSAVWLPPVSPPA